MTPAEINNRLAMRIFRRMIHFLFSIVLSVYIKYEATLQITVLSKSVKVFRYSWNCDVFMQNGTMRSNSWKQKIFF